MSTFVASMLNLDEFRKCLLWGLFQQNTVIASASARGVRLKDSGRYLDCARALPFGSASGPCNQPSLAFMSWSACVEKVEHLLKNRPQEQKPDMHRNARNA